MTGLPQVLDALVAEAPVDRMDWKDVEERSRRARRSQTRGPRRAVTVALAITALGVAGTAIGIGSDLLTQQERFHARAPDDPARRGPLVEIAAGEEWALVAWNSDAGICLDFAVPGNSAFSCGFPVRGAKRADDASGAGLPTHAVAGSVSGGGLVGGDGKTTVFGVAARDVVRVQVELRDGRVLEARLYDAPPSLGAAVRFFIVRMFLPPTRLRGEGPVRAFVAYDRAGTVIDRYAG